MQMLICKEVQAFEKTAFLPLMGGQPCLDIKNELNYMLLIWYEEPLTISETVTGRVTYN